MSATTLEGLQGGSRQSRNLEPTASDVTSYTRIGPRAAQSNKRRMPSVFHGCPFTGRTLSSAITIDVCHDLHDFVHDLAAPAHIHLPRCPATNAPIPLPAVPRCLEWATFLTRRLCARQELLRRPRPKSFTDAALAAHAVTELNFTHPIAPSQTLSATNSNSQIAPNPHACATPRPRTLAALVPAG